MKIDLLINEYHKLRQLQKNFVVVTLVNHQGSVPQELGARLIVTDDGYYAGTIGGGKVEKAAIDKSLALLKESEKAETLFVDWNLQRDIGMSCGGVVSLFFEVFKKTLTWNIVIFGAGHISQELNRILERCDCQITCIDSRQEWLDKIEESSKIKKIHLLDMPSFVKNLKGHEFVVICTMGHSTDLPILQEIIKSKKIFPYLGVIGSDVKAQKLRKNIEESDGDDGKNLKFFCPIGENIGNNTPPEIAISIVAQMLKFRGE